MPNTISWRLDFPVGTPVAEADVVLLGEDHPLILKRNRVQNGGRVAVDYRVELSSGSAENISVSAGQTVPTTGRKVSVIGALSPRDWARGGYATGSVTID